MKQHIGVGLIHLYLCSILLAITVYAGPLPANNNQQELDVLQIPLENRKELDILTVGTSEDLTDRNKRTIGLLREIFPEITKQIDEQANRVISKVLRVLGPTVLRAAIQGNNPSTNTRNNFDSDFDDEDNDSSDDSNGSNDNGTRVSIELPTFSPDEDFSNESSTVLPNETSSENVFNK